MLKMDGGDESRAQNHINQVTIFSLLLDEELNTWTKAPYHVERLFRKYQSLGVIESP